MADSNAWKLNYTFPPSAANAKAKAAAEYD